MSNFDMMGPALALEGTAILGAASIVGFAVENSCFLGARLLQEQEAQGNWETAKKAVVYTLTGLGVIAGAGSIVTGGAAVASGTVLVVAILGGSAKLAGAAAIITGLGSMGLGTCYTIKAAHWALNPPSAIKYDYYQPNASGVTYV